MYFQNYVADVKLTHVDTLNVGWCLEKRLTTRIAWAFTTIVPQSEKLKTNQRTFHPDPQNHRPTATAAWREPFPGVLSEDRDKNID